MTAKKKAVNLIERFKVLKTTRGQKQYNTLAKQCALICVDEIIKNKPWVNMDSSFKDIDPDLKYWRGVKSEIEKL